MTGIKLSGDKYIGNLGQSTRIIARRDSIMTVPGAIILCAIAILVSLWLLWRSERKQAAVGRR